MNVLFLLKTKVGYCNKKGFSLCFFGLPLSFFCETENRYCSGLFYLGVGTIVRRTKVHGPPTSMFRRGLWRGLANLELLVKYSFPSRKLIKIFLLIIEKCINNYLYNNNYIV